MRTPIQVVVALQVCGCLAYGVVDACENPIRLFGRAAGVEYPILRFEVIDIPSAGTVEGVLGQVDLLVRAGGFIAVRDGGIVGDGARLRICAGAGLVVRFSETERIEFHPAGEVRWVELRRIAAK